MASTAKKVGKKAAKKKAPAKAKKSVAHGGKRKGAGRPVGTGTGTGEHARINRVVAMLSNAEMAVLETQAKKTNLPLGTMAYQILIKGLKLKAQPSINGPKKAPKPKS